MLPPSLKLRRTTEALAEVVSAGRQAQKTPDQKVRRSLATTLKRSRAAPEVRTYDGLWEQSVMAKRRRKRSQAYPVGQSDGTPGHIVAIAAPRGGATEAATADTKDALTARALLR